MLKLQRYLLKEHFGPFIFTLFVFMFLFIVKFLLQYSERIFGKGLPFEVIIEFIFVNLAWMVALTVPMSVLVATLMAFGRFSADNEIIALKSAGITVIRLLRSPLLFALVLTLFMYWFNDQVLPDLNHRARIMLSEVSRKKPTLVVEPGTFTSFDNGRVHILVEALGGQLPDSSDIEEMITGPVYNANPDLLEGVSIFATDGRNGMRTITAEYGFLILNEALARIEMTLFNGEIHERDPGETDQYRRSTFKKNVFSRPAGEFILQENRKSSFRTDREMSVGMMRDKIAQLRQGEIEFREKLSEAPLSLFPSTTRDRNFNMQVSEKMLADATRKSKAAIQALRNRLKYLHSEIERKQIAQLEFEVEVHKKYSIPFACIVFILIGAPLGIMARKGGLAIGFSLSIAFFLIYWISLILGESLANDGTISPFLAMWGANILVGVLGIYLVIKAVRESTFIRWDEMWQKYRRLRALILKKSEHSIDPN
jgi:lipopolysaccharide export system permease protein